MIDNVVITNEPPVLWQDYCGTSFSPYYEPAITFGMRLGRCYELSARGITDGDLHDGILIHGSMRCENGESERMGHGWVLLNDGTEVWEPITGRCYAREDWYAWAEAEEERRYDPEQVRIQMLIHGTFGRWHESEWP